MVSYDISDDYFAPRDPEPEVEYRYCRGCGYIFDPSEEGPYCDACYKDRLMSWYLVKVRNRLRTLRSRVAGVLVKPDSYKRNNCCR